MPFFREELPLTVRQAAIYLGVSVQTVYLWLERKQIPYLRVMGRNHRFLAADIVPFRAAFKQRGRRWQDLKEHDGVVYRRLKRKIFWVRNFDRTGKRIRESTFTEDW